MTEEDSCERLRGIAGSTRYKVRMANFGIEAIVTHNTTPDECSVAGVPDEWFAVEVTDDGGLDDGELEALESELIKIAVPEAFS